MLHESVRYLVGLSTIIVLGVCMAKKKSGGKWIQKASDKMEEKGTKGSFGPATKENIAKGKAKGGKQKKKAEKRKKKGKK